MTIPTIADYPMPAPATWPANRARWAVEPARAVLLIHDMQAYFLRFYPEDSALVAALTRNLARLRAWADGHGVPVVYTAQPHAQDAQARALLNDLWGPGLTAADADAARILPALAPKATDTVLDKWRYSAFQRSDLLLRMQAWRRDQIVIGGVYAHIGVMATALDAFMRDIQAFVVGDAVADFSGPRQQMALDYVATRCGNIISTSELVQST